MSMLIEMGAFLIPDLKEPVQIAFFSLMVGLALYTCLKVKKTATPEKWEANWNGGTANDTSDDLDAEHGSVSDISNAVATSWEKLSEAMPGILLILGLLGTFLGLGIALNKASTILGGASTAGMEDSMTNLMGMMQGLGTKFKTSTWGIMAFLFLKVWISYDGFEERRLRWCIRKVKGELDSKRLASKQQQHTEHQEFITSIQQLGERLSGTLQTEITGNRDVLQQSQELLLRKVELSTHNKAGIAAVTNLLKLQLEKNEALNVKTLATHSILNTLGENLCLTFKTEIEGNRYILQQNQATLSRHETLITQNNSNLVDIKNVLELQLNENKAMAVHAQATSSSLESFIQENTSNLEKMQNASSKMADAASNVGESAANLTVAIASFKNGVSDVLGTLKQDLGAVMVQMGEQTTESAADLKVTIGNFQTGVSDVMTTMKSDLRESIAEMNVSFGNNMSKMSSNLETATTGIASAISLLSTSVEKTMIAVETTIGESLKIQKSAQVEFLNTSANLNENVSSMTGLVNKLQEDIKSGLKSVSESNRNVASLNSRYANVTEGVSSLASEIKTSFENYTSHLKENGASDKAQESFNAMLAQLGKIDDHLYCAKEVSGKNQESFSATLTKLGIIDDRLLAVISMVDNKKELSESEA